MVKHNFTTTITTTKTIINNNNNIGSFDGLRKVVDSKGSSLSWSRRRPINQPSTTPY